MYYHVFMQFDVSVSIRARVYYCTHDSRSCSGKTEYTSAVSDAVAQAYHYHIKTTYIYIYKDAYTHNMVVQNARAGILNESAHSLCYYNNAAYVFGIFGRETRKRYKKHNKP